MDWASGYRFLYWAIIIGTIVAVGFACGVGFTLKVIIDAWTGR